MRLIGVLFVCLVEARIVWLMAFVLVFNRWVNEFDYLLMVMWLSIVDDVLLVVG